VTTYSQAAKGRVRTGRVRTGGHRVRSLKRAGIYLLLGIGVLLWIIPLIWALSSAFKSNSEIFTSPPQWVPSNPTLDNFRALGHVNFFQWMFNSLWISAVSTAIAVFVCALGGYAFAKYEFPGKSVLFSVLFSSMMVPFAVILIPLFIEITDLNLGDSYLALLIPWLAPAFGIFMMRQFITQSVPTALLEAARIDGASEFYVFLRIVLPTVRAAVAALAVWQFLTTFNNFMWPLVVISDPARYTLPVGLNSLEGTFTRQYGTVIAGAVLSAVPAVILFWVLRKKLIEGLTVGAVKG
jgi:ABC-type glycerol-3-phosphate transport system permease component